MGCIYSINKKLKRQVLLLESHIDELKTNYSEASCKIILLKKDIEAIRIDKKILKKDKNILREKMEYIKDVLGNSEHVAESILTSKLNCDWLDDTKEKIYLISIIDFLYVVCINENINVTELDHSSSPNTSPNTSPNPSTN